MSICRYYSKSYLRSKSKVEKSKAREVADIEEERGRKKTGERLREKFVHIIQGTRTHITHTQNTQNV